nr:hypothetical protein [uncultured Campylobacter sp.]
MYVVAHCMRITKFNIKLHQILKFMNEHITALNLVASGYEP